MMRPSSRDWAWVVGSVIFILSPLLFGALYVWQKHQWGQTELERVTPRYARLLGVQQNAARIDESLAQVKQQLSRYVYPAEGDATQAGNDAQQRVRSVLSSAGLTVVSSQVLPSKAEQSFDRIGLSVRVDGELIHLQSALAVIPSLTPIILIDSINVQVVGLQRADRPQNLAIQLNLSVLRAKPV
jgi:general secretion pathway protein M